MWLISSILRDKTACAAHFFFWGGGCVEKTQLRREDRVLVETITLRPKLRDVAVLTTMFHNDHEAIL